jgi:luciferase family oxidoreductase group 1
MKLSVLDLSPVGAGVAPSQALRDSVALAQVADRLGFTRYWFAEHHNMASIAASAPEVLIAHIAAVTSRIRVGAGGIMIPNHAPLHVVEVFRALEALHPGRIDLGLQRGEADVNSLLAELLAFERGNFPPSHPFAKIEPMPSDVRIGALWMLGSTLAGASIAAQLGLRYAFAGHFAMRYAKEAIAHYKATFQPSKELAAPYAMLAVTAICGVDDADAERLAAPVRVAIVKNRTGRRGPIVSIDEALAYQFSDDERAIADEFFTGAVIGGSATAAVRLRALATEVGADEMMLSTLVPDPAARAASLERIAAAV